jgi:hypothetical protein
MTIPRATYTGGGDVVLRFPYDARLVELLKAEIPPCARSYDSGDKTWTVSASYAALALRLLVMLYPDARIERSGTRSDPDPHRSAACPFAVLHLLPTAPPELIEGAYRILARLHHPDTGGTNEAMIVLNAARDALRGVAAS